MLGYLSKVKHTVFPCSQNYKKKKPLSSDWNDEYFKFILTNKSVSPRVNIESF